jgi:protocatechuate 3,4-dioxygenase, beta subunit
MKQVIVKGLCLFLGSIVLTCCTGQVKNTDELEQTIESKKKLIGGGCDGCELMHIGMPTNINSADTSAGWNEKGQKLLVTGTVYKPDGKTPAPNVIIYYWQTDTDGYYSPRKEMDEKAKRHGHIRGWVKTDQNGKYFIYTIRPCPYPKEDIPSHIHTSIKEPTIDNEYYIDEFVFDDDPLLTREKRNSLENRGGSGVLRILISGDLQIAEHNIILGLNIPNYPITIKTEKKSGLEVGEDNPSFIPFHAWGPDRGTRTCPVCKYGRYHGIVYFVGNKPNWSEIKKWLTFLEQESVNRSKYLKAYFVYGNEIGYNQLERQKELEKIGKELSLSTIALTFVPSFADSESEVNLNKINSSVENTFIIYRHRNIINKFIDLRPTPENFRLISTTLDKTKSDYFELPEPKHN